MLIPQPHQADQILEEAEKSNPGPWTAHSRYAAKAASLIAGHIPELSPEAAYVFGLLHDIGRWKGVSDMLHIIDGYRLMMDMGYPEVARICLTHSFPLQDVCTMKQNWDGSIEDHEFIRAFLGSVEYNPYDQLIQLCDALALPDGFCLIEKRLIDVALRRGINEYTIPKWKATFNIKQAFDQKIGHSIYELLPGVVGTTFEWMKPPLDDPNAQS